MTTALGSSAGTSPMWRMCLGHPEPRGGHLIHRRAGFDTTGGNLLGWNGHGQLGTVRRRRSRPVPGGRSGDGVVRLVAGGASTCAVLVTGRATCWGWNAFGQLVTAHARFSAGHRGGITDAVDDRWQWPCLAPACDGAGVCMGWNFYGQLGDGTTADHQALPRLVQVASRP